jgi:hypothetical protein
MEPEGLLLCSHESVMQRVNKSFVVLVHDMSKVRAEHFRSVSGLMACSVRRRSNAVDRDLQLQNKAVTATNVSCYPAPRPVCHRTDAEHVCQSTACRAATRNKNCHDCPKVGRDVSYRRHSDCFVEDTERKRKWRSEEDTASSALEMEAVCVCGTLASACGCTQHQTRIIVILTAMKTSNLTSSDMHLITVLYWKLPTDLHTPWAPVCS